MVSFRSEHLRVALFRRELLHRPRILIISLPSIFLDDSSLIYDLTPDSTFLPDRSCTKNATCVRPSCKPLKSLHGNNDCSIVRSWSGHGPNNEGGGIAFWCRRAQCHTLVSSARNAYFQHDPTNMRQNHSLTPYIYIYIY